MKQTTLTCRTIAKVFIPFLFVYLLHSLTNLFSILFVRDCATNNTSRLLCTNILPLSSLQQRRCCLHSLKRSLCFDFWGSKGRKKPLWSCLSLRQRNGLINFYLCRTSLPNKSEEKRLRLTLPSIRSNKKHKVNRRCI